MDRRGYGTKAYIVCSITECTYCRVFRDVQAYVSCRGYDCILISAQRGCEARWYRGFVDSSLAEKRFSAKDFFVIDEGRTQ